MLDFIIIILLSVVILIITVKYLQGLIKKTIVPELEQIKEEIEQPIPTLITKVASARTILINDKKKDCSSDSNCCNDSEGNCTACMTCSQEIPPLQLIPKKMKILKSFMEQLQEIQKL